MASPLASAAATAAVPPPLLPPSSANSSQRERRSLAGDDNVSSAASSWVGNSSSNANSNHPILIRQEGEEYFIPIRGDEGEGEDDRDNFEVRQRRRARRKRQQQQRDQDDRASSEQHLQQEIQQQQQNQSAPSLSDRLTSSAVSGTLGLLRLASDVTLSTTGKLVAPPLQVTQYVILPALYAAFVDFLSSMTSQRVKDWFRIVQASVHHLVSVLQSTPAGLAFRQEVVQVGGDIVEVVSSDTSRQVIADGMACLVKFSETLHTPQMKALLDQLGVLSCRCIDAASSGRLKQLWLDVWTTIWSGTAVLADPATTMALAEVTAHLCHALEMEEAVHRKQMLQKENPSNTAAPSATASQRRYRRNQYQAAAYVHTDLTIDPDATVEDVIISSLGDAAAAAASTTTAKSAAATNRSTFSQHEIPKQVTLTTIHSQGRDYTNDDDDVLDHSRHASPSRLGRGNGSEHASTKTPQKQEQQQNQHGPLYNHIPAKAREETVDVTFLRECIQQRYEDQQRTSKTSGAVDVKNPPFRAGLMHRHDQGRDAQDNHDNNDSLEDLEELVTKTTSTAAIGILKTSQTPTKVGPSSRRPQKPVVQDVVEDDEEDYDDEDDDEDYDDKDCQEDAAKTVIAEEAPVAQFYRILDEILTQKRQDAIQGMLDQTEDNATAARNDGKGASKNQIDGKATDASTRQGGRVWYPLSAAAAGAGNERGQATMRHQLSQLKQQSGVGSTLGLGYSHHRRRASTMSIPSKYKLLVLGLIATVLLFGTIWFGLGCYGIYKLMYPSGKFGSKVLGKSPSLSIPKGESSFPSSQQEIVIRIIREVVHVDAADGSILPQVSSSSSSGAGIGSGEQQHQQHFVTGLDEKAMNDIAECVAAAATTSAATS